MIQTETITLICPVCGSRLEHTEKSYICKKRHSFDIARQGYVNLLPVQNKHSLSPGDTKAMLTARRDFLNQGYYEPICRDIIDRIRHFSTAKPPVLADIGSGEGYYTAAMKNACHAVCIGIDIAKEASRMSCGRDKEIVWAVATASHLPLEDASADIVTAVFSLFLNDEYARVLRSGGLVAEVTAGSDHLRELKAVIYDEVFQQHKQPAAFGSQFELLQMEDRRFTICLDSPQLQQLLAMTPHIHRISKEQSERLLHIQSLTLTVNYIIRILRKK